MNKSAARAGLITLVVLVSVLNGSPLAVPIIGLAARGLYRLVDYGAREVERALRVASDERIAQLTWQLRTDAAHLALQRRRLADQRDRWLQDHLYTLAPHWPTEDPDACTGQLEKLMIPAITPTKPEPVVYRGPKVDEILFADGGLLCVPAALRLYRYADAS